jgi:DNA modification methylase
MTDLLDLQYYSIDDVELFDRNAKLHNLELIAEAIRRYGLKKPLRWEPELNQGRGAIAAGNGRLEALRMMRSQGEPPPRGVKVTTDGIWEVPILVGVEALTEAEAQSYAIDDNNLSLASAGMSVEQILELWDQRDYADLLQTLEAEGVSPVSIGDDDLAQLLAAIEESCPPNQGDTDLTGQLLNNCDDIESRVSPGEVWSLGCHRLACGDSTDNDQVKTLLGKHWGTVDMIFTDPPYNINYHGKTNSSDRTTTRMEIANDNFTNPEDFRAFLQSFFDVAIGACSAGAAIYVCYSDMEAENFQRALKDAGWLLKQNLIWVKQNGFVVGRQDYHWQHESILYGWKPGAAHRWYSDRTQSTVLNFDRPTVSREHPTMKPIDLVQYILGNSSAPDSLIYDGFLGSGTTLLAAQSMTGKRRVFGFEISPQYCEVICRRYENLTGDLAKRVGRL